MKKRKRKRMKKKISIKTNEQTKSYSSIVLSGILDIENLAYFNQK